MTDAPDRFSDVHLTLCLTHDCNLRCRYCYGGAKSKRHMSLGVGRAAIDRAVARTSERLHLVFFGGEPLLRWRTLVALTDAAARRTEASGLTLRPTATTNGTLLTDERVAWLAGHGFVLAISCDGTKAAHDANRRDARRRSSHARTVAGLRLALGAGLRVRVILVLHPDNITLLPESLAYLREQGADDFVVNPDWSADWRDEALRERWERAYGGAAKLWIEGHRTGRPFWVSVVDDKIAAELKGGYTAAERCDLGRRNLVVRERPALPVRSPVGRTRAGTSSWATCRRGQPARVAALVATAACRPSASGADRAALPQPLRVNLALTGDVAVPSETLCFHEQLAVRVADAAAETLAAEGNTSFLARARGASGPRA